MLYLARGRWCSTHAAWGLGNSYELYYCRGGQKGQKDVLNQWPPTRTLHFLIKMSMRNFSLFFIWLKCVCNKIWMFVIMISIQCCYMSFVWIYLSRIKFEEILKLVWKMRQQAACASYSIHNEPFWSLWKQMKHLWAFLMVITLLKKHWCKCFFKHFGLLNNINPKSLYVLYLTLFVAIKFEEILNLEWKMRQQAASYLILLMSLFEVYENLCNI